MGLWDCQSVIKEYIHVIGNRNLQVRCTLTPEDRRRRDRRILRCSIRHYNESAFKYFHDSKDDLWLLNLTGLDHASFNELLE